MNLGIFFRSLLLCLVLGMPLGAAADDLDVVKAFYSDLLSNPRGADLDDRVRKVIVEDWVSIPTPRGGKGADGFVKSLRGFGETLPDLKWVPQEILRDGNRFIVRSIATGTPAKPFFGVPPNGKGFEIMSIDIHTVEDGRIVKSYHIEEWHKALRQLKK